MAVVLLELTQVLEQLHADVGFVLVEVADAGEGQEIGIGRFLGLFEQGLKLRREVILEPAFGECPDDVGIGDVVGCPAKGIESDAKLRLKPPRCRRGWPRRYFCVRRSMSSSTG